MTFELEYLEKGEVHIHGLGTFGIEHFDRKKKKLVTITRLACTEALAREMDQDKRFKVQGLNRADIADKKPKHKGGK